MTPAIKNWLLITGLIAAEAGADIDVRVRVAPDILVAAAPRIGLNLAEWNTWGASQFMGNVLKNPGLEGVIDRTLVIVARADFRGFSDDTRWTGRPDGFWAGARYDVVSGPARGASGKLVDSRRRGPDDLPVFLYAEPGPELGTGDVVVLTRYDDTEPPAHWWWPADLGPGQIRAALDDRRPGSPGARALTLETQLPSRPARLVHALDAISDRAGKLLPLEGRWNLSFWVRADAPDTRLQLRLQRLGSAPILRETLAPGSDWQRVERSIDAHDPGPASVVQLEFLVENGTILLDDVSLAPANLDASGFRAELVSALERLRPGYLRDWQGQLGDTWSNRSATPFARRATRYRPGPEAGSYLYGLPEFLDLCRRVGSLPWIILPTTLLGDEYEALGRYLAGRQAADGFAEMVVEFGNENWNAVFRPGGIPDPILHGRVAEEAFARVRQGAGPDTRLAFAVDGQHVNPDRALRMLDGAPGADLLVVAPYFLAQLDDIGPEQAWPLLFETDPYLPRLVRGARDRRRELAVYEVNLHTTRGSAPAELRDPVVAGAAAGSALAGRLLQAATLGVRRQCVWNLAQFDTFLEDHQHLVRLWGVVRDLGATQRPRPTGLALTLLNQVLPGDTHALEFGPAGEASTGPFARIGEALRHLAGWLGRQADSKPGPARTVPLQGIAVRKPEGWALALASSSPEPLRASIGLPTHLAGQPPRRILRLDAAAPGATNEDEERVRIVETAVSDPQRLELTLPPYGLAVLLP